MNTAFLLLNASKKLKYNLNQAMEHYDLTAQQWIVLQKIGQTKNNEVITAGQLSKLLEIDKQTLSGIIKRLEEKELIIRNRNLNDQRIFSLHLSSSEKKYLNKYTAVSNQVLEQFLSPLSAAEREILNQLLSKLQPEGEG